MSFRRDLAKAVDAAAAASGTAFSAWIVETAYRRLRLEPRGGDVAEWEADTGPFSETELAGGFARVPVVEGAARRSDEVILTSNNIRKIVETTGKRIRIEPV